MATTVRRKITIDHTKVDAALTNFPLLVRLTSANFTFGATAGGTDVRFRAADGVTALTFERERHVAGSSVAEYWVLLPSIADTVDTEFWIYYGDDTASDLADTGGAVWDADFLGVYHLNDTPSTLSHVGTSAVAVGTTTVTPAQPTAYTPVAGDLDIVVVVTGGTGPPTVTSPGAGYTSLGTGTGGAGAAGSAAGPRRLTYFHRTLAGGEGTPAFTCTGTGAVMCATRTILRKSAGGSYALSMSTGADNTDGTGVSATMGATLEFRPSIMAVAAIGLNDNAAGSGQTLTATGATFGTVTEQADAGTTSGDDARQFTYTADVTVGKATAAAVLATTLGVASSGVGAVAMVQVTGDVADASGTGNHGASRGMTAAPEAARTGLGTHLDGAQGHVDLPSFGSLAAATVEVWFNADSVAVAHAGLVSKQDFNTGALAFKENAGVLTAQAAGGGTAATIAGDTAATWYYAAVTWAQSGNLVLRRDLTSATTTAGTAAMDASAMEIGHEFVSYASAARFFDGLVDEVRISDVVRSAAWLTASYHSGAGTLLSVGPELFAEAAAATGQAFDAIPAVGGNAGQAAGSAAAFDATVTTVAGPVNAPAEAAAATATAADANTAVTIPAGAAAAAGAAFDATPAGAAAAGAGTATVTGFDTSAAVTAAADVGQAAATAADTSTALTVPAQAAAGSAAAFDATVSTVTAANAPAETTSAAATGYDTSTALTVPAETAAGAATAADPLPAVAAAAGAAAASGQAFDASPAVAVVADAAAGSAAAFDATVSTVAAAAAPAEAGSVAGQAFDAAAAVGVAAELASGSAAAFDATVSTSSSAAATAGAGEAAASGYDTSTAVGVAAGQASGSAAAFDATVSTATAVQAPAQATTAAAFAYDASGAAAPLADTGTVGAIAHDPTPSVGGSSGAAAASAAAFDASIATGRQADAEAASAAAAALAASVQVLVASGTAGVAATAFNATILAVSEIVPFGLVESAGAGSGQVAGSGLASSDMDATVRAGGPDAGVLAGSGVVE